MSLINSVSVRSATHSPMGEFLESHDYIITEVKEGIYKVSRDFIEVFLSIDEHNIFFQLEVGDLSQYEDLAIYRDLLDLNTEILPVSLGLDRTSSGSPRLLILESRETKNIDENEILSVFESMEIALFKVEKILTKYVIKKIGD